MNEKEITRLDNMLKIEHELNKKDMNLYVVWMKQEEDRCVALWLQQL